MESNFRFIDEELQMDVMSTDNIEEKGSCAFVITNWKNREFKCFIILKQNDVLNLIEKLKEISIK